MTRLNLRLLPTRPLEPADPEVLAWHSFLDDNPGIRAVLGPRWRTVRAEGDAIVEGVGASEDFFADRTRGLVFAALAYREAFGSMPEYGLDLVAIRVLELIADCVWVQPYEGSPPAARQDIDSELTVPRLEPLGRFWSEYAIARRGDQNADSAAEAFVRDLSTVLGVDLDALVDRREGDEATFYLELGRRVGPVLLLDLMVCPQPDSSSAGQSSVHADIVVRAGLREVTEGRGGALRTRLGLAQAGGRQPRESASSALPELSRQLRTFVPPKVPYRELAATSFVVPMPALPRTPGPAQARARR